MVSRPVQPVCRGFSLVELLVVVAVFGIVVAVGMPMFGAAIDGARLSSSARDVERELQTARLKAVAAKRPMRVRFDCPAPGMFRMVEVIGSPSVPDTRDTASNRCSADLYPYPSRVTTRLDRPRHDGPVRLLPRGVRFDSAPAIEFLPDGTAHADISGSNPWPVIPGTAPIEIRVSYTKASRTITKSITVNGLGKIRTQ